MKNAIPILFRLAHVMLAAGLLGPLGAAAAPEPALAITGVHFFRTDAGWLAVAISVAGNPDPARFRVLLDTDGPGQGAPGTGADFMIEGPAYFQYPPSVKDWSWNILPPPVVLVDGRTVTYVLPDPPSGPRIRWCVEATNPDWSTADRFPQAGMREFALADLPRPPRMPLAAPADLSELTRRMPRSLSFRLDAEIKDRIWTAESNAPAWRADWSVPGCAAPLALGGWLEDAVSGDRAGMEPAAVLVGGDTRRYTGVTLGVGWDVLVASGPNGERRVSGQLQSTNERCLRVFVGAALDPVGWTWHDDAFARRIVTAGTGVYATTQFPIGVLAADAGALMVETDLAEPRAFQITADPARQLFGVAYSLALTDLTSNFPGRSAFAFCLRSLPVGGPSAFRLAWADFNRRHPDYGARRVPRIGQWLAFADPANITNAADFGFAAETEVFGGGSGRPAGALARYLYSMPALLWLPIPAGMDRTAANVMRLLQLHAALARDQLGDQAAAALSSAARGPGQNVAIDCAESAVNPGVRIENNLDPEIPTASERPINRAMSEWRYIREGLLSGPFSGIYCDQLGGLTNLDYHTAALAVADHPAVFAPDVLRPAVAPLTYLFEYLAPLSALLRERGRFVAGASSGDWDPFLVGQLDVLIENVRWYDHGQYRLPPEGELWRRRALAGHKPFVFLMGADFEHFTGAVLRRYLMDCLFYGMVPGLLASPGASHVYWAQAEWYERDRDLFKTCMPLINRIAESGWEPIGPAQAADEGIQVENFGRPDGVVRHFTFKPVGAGVSSGIVQIACGGQPLVIMDPLTAAAEWVLPGTDGRAMVTVPGATIGLRDLIAPEGMTAAREFLEQWRPADGEAEAARNNLASLSAEYAFGAVGAVQFRDPAVDDEANRFEVKVRNLAGAPVQVADLKVISSHQFRSFDDANATVTPGATSVVSGYFTRDDIGGSSWLEIQWTMRRGRDERSCSRWIRPIFAPPVRVTPRTVSLRTDELAVPIQLSLENLSTNARTVRIDWRGDFEGGRQDATLQPGETRLVSLPVTGDEPGAGRMLVRVKASGRELSADWFDVSLGRSSAAVP